MANKVINTILNLKDNFSKTIDKTTKNTKQFQREVKQAQNEAKRMRESFVKGFTAISAGVTAAGVGMFALVNKTAEAMDEIDKMSERTGITRERLQELKYAAGQCGVELSSIENGVKMLTKNMGKADDESKRMTEAFKDMGIKIKDNKGNLKASNALFEESIMKLADMKDQTQRNILGQKIFGGSWQDMIPLINQGSKGIKELTDRSRQLGLIVSEDAVKANVVFGDTLSDVKQSIGALGTKLSNVALPYLQKFLDFSLIQIPKIEPKIKEMISKITDGIRMVKDNLNWLLPVLSGVLGAFIAFQVVTTIAGVYLKFKKATEGLTIAQAILNATMLSNPFVQVALGVGLLIAAGVALWKNWDTISAKGAKLWGGLKESFTSGTNWVVDKLNWLLEKINKIPGIKIPLIPKIASDIKTSATKATGMREFARGGIATRPSIFGDGREPEIAIPLRPNNPRSQQLLNQADNIINPQKQVITKATKETNKGIGDVIVYIYGNVYGEEDLINRVGSVIQRKVKMAYNNM